MMSKFCHYITLFAIFQCICVSQQVNDTENDCYKAGECNEPTECIWQYRELESYVLRDNSIVDNLTEAFFRTGKHPSRYVKITYNFHISDPVNSSNETEEYFDYNCTNLQNVYIWSESPFYLLGPKPLFWFSLFAINVPEASVTVELPCLCRHAYNRLLSRLTYMIKVISIKDISSEQFVEFINPNYFRARGRDHDNYKSIVIIFIITIPFPITSAILLFYITSLYIAPEVYKIKKTQHSKMEDPHKDDDLPASSEDQSNFEEGQPNSEDQSINLEEGQPNAEDRSNSQGDRPISYFTFIKDGLTFEDSHIKTLLLTSVIITVALIAFHIIADVKYIQYGNEILDNEEYKFGDDWKKSDHQVIPIWHAIISFLTILVSTCIVLLIFTKKCLDHDKYFDYVDNNDKRLTNLYICKNKEFQNFLFHKAAALAIVLNIIYVGSIFAPYMLLAFIDDPVQTSFIYFLVAIAVVCLFFLSYSIISLFTPHSNSERLNCLVYGSWAAVISIVYMLVVIIYMYTLGSFSNFEALQTLILPSLIGLFSLILLKLVKTENNKQLQESSTIDPDQDYRSEETVINMEEDGVIHNEEAENSL